MNKKKIEIDEDQLRELCLEYDRKMNAYPESEYEGLAIFMFFQHGDDFYNWDMPIEKWKELMHGKNKNR